MIQYLSGIIENGTIRRFCYDLFYGLTFELGSRNKAIEIIYVGLQMFTIMKIYSLLTDYRFQRIISLRKFRHLVSHGYKY